MKYSKEQLMVLSNNTGFRAEILEKVLLLMDLLECFFNDPLLKGKLVLKGGTALNLFYLELPRLSIDIDLNYIGEIDRENMMFDRKRTEERIIAICELQKFMLYRQPSVHAGGKLIWRYPSALGYMGNLEMDLNYMYRIPLLPVSQKTSIQIGDFSVKNIVVLDVHELAAGKLAALIDRSLGRDLFDAYCLFSANFLNSEILRPIFVTYLGVGNKKDICNISVEKITIDHEELLNRLLPMLSKKRLSDIENKKIWITTMLVEMRKSLQTLLPLRANEIAFLDALLDYGEIRPEMITENLQLQKNIKSHPALHWAVFNTQRNKSR
ncbi:MAG TPA: nucleotidyl transferase AbiEii/AbiGii toxin family protein [Coxiellaceae bacterium]|nr:MAG: hypothetical protein A2V89_00740 [Gammaproteobacteria bacterium RBG_16_37_9]HBC71853.1 nucleotidyl transferase AbiEii/AbiGii toxin family protein [Coxiellaceae bacterium]